MAQAQIDEVNCEEIILFEERKNRIVCRLGIVQEVVVKKVKGELKICLKENSKTLTITGDFFERLLTLSESLQLVAAFVRGN